MNALIRKAAAKKQKFKKFLDKVEKYEEDSDGSISSDDIDSLEEDYIGEILNNDYLILKYVGRGTFSRVWLAHHIPSKTEKVIKMYFSDDKDEFKQEIGIMDILKEKQLKHNVYHEDSFIFNNNSNKYYCIVMPLLGISIQDIIENREKDLSVCEIKHILKYILHGLNELHNYKILHTDLKLDNILTNYIHPDIKKYQEYFHSEFIQNYDNIENYINKKINELLPNEYSSFDKNKKKKFKKKIKQKCNLAFKNELINGFKKLELESNNQLNVESINSSSLQDNLGNTESDVLIIDSDNIEDITGDLKIEEISMDKKSNKYSERVIGNNDSVNLDSSSEPDLNLDTTFNNIDILELQFKIIDFSNSLKQDDIDEDAEYQIRAYRSPENIIGYSYSFKSEVWTIGCILIDLLTNKYIFEPELEGKSEKRDREQLSIMEKYLGKMNKDISLDSPRSYELYEESGRIKGYRKVEKTSLLQYLKDERADLSEQEIEEINHFLKHIFNYNPKLRYNVHDCLHCDFLV